MNSHGTTYASQAAEADRKRAAAKKLIEQYYFQLTEGCGNCQCDNEHCASNTFKQKLKPNQAAALALRLFKAKARLCNADNYNVSASEDSTCMEEVSLPSASISDLDISTPTEDNTCMDISNCAQCVNVDPDKDGTIISFSSSSGVNSASKKIALSSFPSVNVCESSHASDMDVPDPLSKLSHTVSPAKVISESSEPMSATDVPSSEENNSMDVSVDTKVSKANSDASISVPMSEAVVPSCNANKICCEPSSSGMHNMSCMSSELHDENLLPKGIFYLTGINYLDEERLLSIINQCSQEQNFSLLIRTLGQVFSSEESLQNSFTKPVDVKEERSINCKEDIRAMEVDEDKDKDSKDPEESSNSCRDTPRNCTVSVDVESIRRAFKALFSIKDHPFQRALINALLILSENLEYEFKYGSKQLMNGNILNIFVIVMEIPILECPEYMEAAFPAFCKAAAQLPVYAQAALARVWSSFDASRLKEMVDTLHQFITLKVITSQFSREYCINDDAAIVAATKLMKVLYYANMLGGVMDNDSTVPEESEHEEADDSFQDLLQGAIGTESKEPKQVKEDPLSQELNLKPIDCRTPILCFGEFYNEPLSDQLEMDRDFACYKTEGGKFSFMNYSFILTPAVKALGLYYDNRIRMYSERRISVLHSLVHGAPPNPYLKLRVRRDHIIDDALVGLEMVAMENPTNLKKQLVVEFEGEQGIDEGGVSKEFFQLVVEEVFNPDFAMFTLNPETQTYWFNPTSFESDAQFTLIGIILGLAIYNNIILDVHFPMVLYRKLMGKKGTFYDLQDWNPSLSKGLQDLLAYEGEDIESVFVQTFRITYQDVFGTVLVHDLKENGDQILVNQANKKEFVELYASFLLNKSVQKQFRAFRRGFQMVTDDSPLKLLFRPEEIELLVCGSKNFDFNALEESTDYDGGYTSETPIIRWFWELVHYFSLDQKQKLLQFATGSDRVPVGGLSKLKLVIARHGPDSERLPTAHTCFNVLLLPEYSSKEKLEERLLKAINYSKGFGML